MPALTRHVAVVPASRPSAATTGCATASPTCWPTCPRACTACASSPPTTASATTSSTTATWSASTATPTSTPPRSTPSTARAPSCSAASGQAALLGDRRRHGAAPHAQPSAPWSAFFLYLNRFFAADPAAGPAVQHLPAGPGRRSSSCAPCSTTEPTVPEAPDAVELPPIEGEIVFDDVTFGYDPARPGAPRRQPAHRAGRDGRLRRADRGRASRRMAKLVTRFYDPTGGRVLIDGHDLRARDAGLAAPPARRRPPGAVPLRRDDPRQHRLRPARRHRRRGRGGGPRRSGWPSSIERLPDGRRHRRARAGPVALVGRAPAHRPGPGLPRPSPGARARRGHLQPRPAVRDARSRRRSTSCSRAARPSSSPTGCRRP